jgi:ankyrin repeat protein
MVRLFQVKKGAKIDGRKNNGYTALHEASLAGHENVVKFLIDNDANFDAQVSMS